MAHNARWNRTHMCSNTVRRATMSTLECHARFAAGGWINAPSGSAGDDAVSGDTCVILLC